MSGFYSNLIQNGVCTSYKTRFRTSTPVNIKLGPYCVQWLVSKEKKEEYNIAAEWGVTNGNDEFDLTGNLKAVFDDSGRDCLCENFTSPY